MLSAIGVHELRPVNDATLRALNPQTMVLAFAPFAHNNAPATMDNINKARQRIAQRVALLPNCKIVVRWWEDDHRSRRMTAAEFARDFFRLQVPGTLMLASNEDAVDKHNADVYKETVAWWTDCVRLATEARIPLAVGCMATGNPDYPQYPLLVPLLTAMRDAARKGVVHWFYSNAYWSPDDAGYREHHLERHQRELRKVCRAHNLPVPPTMIGEIGIAWGYDALAGYRRKGMTPDVFAESLCVESNRLDVPVNVYSAGVGIFDSRWIDFDVDTPEFWSVVTRKARRVPLSANRDMEKRYMDEANAQAVPAAPVIAMPPASFEWGAMQLKWLTPMTDGSGARIRQAPDTDAPVLVTLGERTKVQISVNGWQNPQDKVTWRRVLLAGGLVGFVGESRIAKLEDATATAPLPPVAPPPAAPPPVPLPDDNAALRANILKAFRDFEVNALQAQRNLIEASDNLRAASDAAKNLREYFAGIWKIPLVEEK